MATLKRMTIDYQALTLIYVDYYDKLSNLFEDLLRLDRFAESIDDELNRIVAAEKESREDP
jgi:hypothetical protein